MSVNRGVAVVHYNRTQYLYEILEAISKTVPENTKLVVCDDGSLDKFDDGSTLTEYIPDNFTLIRGPNRGVAANKNRALFVLQDCDFLAIIEDDLKPISEGWFETYEKAARFSEIHHFCRVQDKLVEESIPAFSAFMRDNSLTPLYGSSPRGDLTFITSKVLREVGGFNPAFEGAGHAHGEWSNRVARAKLIGHPLKWVDIQEARDRFVQIGDTEGGRWDRPAEEIKEQIKRNAGIARELRRTGYVYHPIILG